MKRDEFMTIVDRELDEIKKLYATKNTSYGSNDEAFHNFKETARRVYSDTCHEAMWSVMLTYIDKHMIALTKGITEREFTERCRDIIVYSLLAIGLRQEWESLSSEPSEPGVRP